MSHHLISVIHLILHAAQLIGCYSVKHTRWSPDQIQMVHWMASNEKPHAAQIAEVLTETTWNEKNWYVFLRMRCWDMLRRPLAHRMFNCDVEWILASRIRKSTGRPRDDETRFGHQKSTSWEIQTSFKSRASLRTAPKKAASHFHSTPTSSPQLRRHRWTLRAYNLANFLANFLSVLFNSASFVEVNLNVFDLLCMQLCDFKLCPILAPWSLGPLQVPSVPLCCEFSLGYLRPNTVFPHVFGPNTAPATSPSRRALSPWPRFGMGHWRPQGHSGQSIQAFWHIVTYTMYQWRAMTLNIFFHIVC